MFLKGCEAYGLKPQDLFQVNDLYEAKNPYMVVDNLFTLGGQVRIRVSRLGGLSCQVFFLLHYKNNEEKPNY